jgi:Na+/serine symporter
MMIIFRLIYMVVIFLIVANVVGAASAANYIDLLVWSLIGATATTVFRPT